MRSAIPKEAATRTLLQLAQAGDRKARDRLVAESMPLVEAVVTKQRRPDLHDDLVQAGLCGSSEGSREGVPAHAGGLLRAIERWDADKLVRGKPIRWSTFATWWIRAGVQAELIKNGPLMGPNRRALKRRAKVRKVLAALEARTGKRPTVDEVTGALRVPERRGIIEAAMRPLPAQLLRGPGERDDRMWEDLRAGNTPTPEQALDYVREIERVRAAVRGLPEIERVVIGGIFGIEARELPQDALAKVAGLTPRMLRKVKARALERLQVQLRGAQADSSELEDSAAQGITLGEVNGCSSPRSGAHSEHRLDGADGITGRMGTQDRRPLRFA